MVASLSPRAGARVCCSAGVLISTVRASLTTVGSGVVRDSEKSEVVFLDDFRPRITMGNPIVTEILGFSDVGFSKIEKFSAKKMKK